ncbi:hypothetical protein [Algibacter pectinivorans]|uniref:Uncharacterized protein n=1 Tax=Algibacter pectinivorans TaxID=870482 RepID=A0A1I1P838_9FLAO|nr:hypothetical protein [Algibacter pectinivorans]SFD05762.1 hypothetical protein SAMN04487987_103259 [Algibacter pectinivorans]
MPIKPKKVLKIIAGVLIFFTLPTLLLFGYMHIKYNEDLPVGIQGEQADALAHKMLNTLDYQAFKNTNYIEWTFKKRHHYKWDKANNKCTVYWKQNKVVLDLNNTSKSKVYINNFINTSDLAKELIKQATDYFNNDSFWLVGPYKVFDSGVQRQLVKTETNTEALLVTYNSGGSTPGDSYLWILDENYKPTAFKMWVSILPIEGLEASWSDWTTTKTGAQLPTFHKFLFFGLENENIKTSN